jgi:hypothetical protein
MYGRRNKLVCLFNSVCLSNLVKENDNTNDTSLLQNLSIFSLIHILEGLLWTLCIFESYRCGSK